MGLHTTEERVLAKVAWMIHVREVVQEFECPPYVLSVGQDGGQDGQMVWLQARLWREDTKTGEEGWGWGGKYVIPPDSNDDFIVKRCLVACLSYAEHEVREAALWRRRRIFGPHIPLQALWEVAEESEGKDLPGFE